MLSAPVSVSVDVDVSIDIAIDIAIAISIDLSIAGCVPFTLYLPSTAPFSSEVWLSASCLLLMYRAPDQTIKAIPVTQVWVWHTANESPTATATRYAMPPADQATYDM